MSKTRPTRSGRVMHRLRERGVIRVAASYAVIAWLLLQIADVTFEPLGVPKWVMTSLIVAAVLGFPVAVALAWFYEIGDEGLQRDTAAEGALRPSVHGKRRYADLVIIGVLLATVAVLVVRQSDIGRPPPPANPAIAVLPFENLSGDPAQEYFSDGLAEEVLDRLGRVPGLKVIASSSSFSYKDRNQDAKAIADQLGVTSLLQGSVRRDGRRLKLNARLVDGATGYQLWSGSFDRETTDVFAVQAELAAAVIEAIVPTARGDPVAAPPPTTSLDAHDHYLLGLAAQRARSSARLAESVAHFEQAVALDPSYAQAHAALANSLLLWSTYTYALAAPERRDAAKRAEHAAYKALALDATLSEAHGALGNVLTWLERPGAEDEYKRALELNPNNAIVVHFYAGLLSHDPARKAESDRMLDRALELDPRSAIDWANKLADVRDRQGPAAYREQFNRVLNIFEGDADGLTTLTLAAGYGVGSGFPLEAYRLSDAILRAGGDRVEALLASLDALFAAGDYDEVLARIDEIKSAASDLDATWYAPLEMKAAGLKGDFARVNAVLAYPARNNIAPHYRYMVDAYWYLVQDRMDAAATALARAGDFETAGGGIMGSSLESGALPAVVRIYRATGRTDEAQAIARRFQEQLRRKPGDLAKDPAWHVLLAEVAIANGRRADAVRHLQEAMKRVPIPNRLHPELPWFKELEGEPGYAEVIEELKRRQAGIRAEMTALDATSSRSR